MGFLAGKRILITGLISNRSIAYGIAKACHREGAELAFTYQNERVRDRIAKFADEFGSKAIFPCDVGDDAQIDAVFTELAKHWDGLDGLVHSIAFAPNEAIEGDFLEGMTRESFRIAHDVSSYSYPALAKASLEAATRYLAFCLGPQGIRANVLFAGPIKTLAASGIGNFGKLLAYNAHHAPLRRNVTIDEVGNAAAFLLSDLASGITGEILYVDGGTHTTAMGNADPLPG
jgi:enoyl-[acyl-carrier protein] reductase I